MRIHKWSMRFLEILVLVCAVAPATLADGWEDLGLQIHGFGGWYYGRSDVQFNGATDGGNAETAQFALNLSARPFDRVSVVSQVLLRSAGDNSSDVDLDYAFVDYDLTSRTKVRLGRVKHPFGLYGEIFEVGTARPFQILPQGLYGADGFTAKAYNGAGVTGNVSGASKWALQWDVYAGEIDGDFEDSGMFVATPGTPPPAKTALGFKDKNVFGLRLNLTPPVDGLLFGVSAYQGDEETSNTDTEQKRTYVASAELARGPLVVRGEYGYFEVGDNYDADTAYVEASYRITEHWQVAARWDEFHLHLTIFDVFPNLPPYLLARRNTPHEELAFGVNYWVSRNVVVRASYSRVEGARFLFPTSDELAAHMSSGVPLKDETNVFIVGTQFSF